ncbi:MAG TPA: hypothetical protein PKA54_00805 [Chitinophagaceae bacterium]|nr:MAG: outer membrane receptor protein [Bacteroidetes bacterium OLB11]HMN31891.1 hypothetical protein [Chitinophagaceae bacterium]
MMITISKMVEAQSDMDTLEDKSKSPKVLEEVIITGKNNLSNKQTKILSSLDSYLESNAAINMIKRGAYAGEPFINGMATERSLITIDGMRIYGACTDKMDPITSYVEITNLSKANIQSGQSGAQHGATIAGSIDLVRKHSECNNTGFKGNVFTGIESNNFQKIIGTKLQYSGCDFYTDFDFTFRDADNYKAGGGAEILYSQFRKYNLSGMAGYKLNDKQDIAASVIYDHATDVGYPALPMDVSMAKAFITSLQHSFHEVNRHIHYWESKIYYNHVTHIMDDSKRPIVPIRMDMPGWTNTAGFYSFINGSYKKHLWKMNLSGHFNKSLAEMTMYSNNTNNKDMFMLTWPDVRTYFSNLFIEDKVLWNENWSSVFTAGAAIQYNNISDTLGYETLKIFYPNLQHNHLRWLNNIGAKLMYANNHWTHQFGLAYGNRAPSVSEGYGFYLFNSFDRWDYIGNPYMKNESSFEISESSTFNTKRFSAKAQINYFRMNHYIIGIPDTTLTSMTIGANGVKIYDQLPNADLFNIGLNMTYRILSPLSISSKFIYRLGKTQQTSLPQIQPFTYGAAIKYEQKTFATEISMEGALAQTTYGSEFGETKAPAYTIFNIGISKSFLLNKHELGLRGGIENILDANYSTFADWNRIPRMGRNLYLNFVWKF